MFRWVTVGGTRQYNDWMTEVSPHDSARIWSRAAATFPTIAGAKVLEERVGLRPHRHTVRSVNKCTMGAGVVMWLICVKNGLSGKIRICLGMKRKNAFRVELEQLGSGLAVVHNYGHCGYGVLSSPGTGLHAAKLVKSVLDR